MRECVAWNQEFVMEFLKEVQLCVLAVNILLWNPESEMVSFNSLNFLCIFLGLGLGLWFV